MGKSYDAKAGMVDNHARWYAPDFGRFVTADTYRGELQTPYTQNRYAYVGNNPVNRWDPLGYEESGTNNSGSNSEPTHSVDPSGTYYPDGSFTPKDDGSSGSGGSGHHSGGGGSHEPTASELYSQNQNYLSEKAGALPQTTYGGSTGTVSRAVMDAYYSSFRGMTDAKVRNDWAGAGQAVLKAIDKKLFNLDRYSSSTVSVIENRLDGMVSITDELIPRDCPMDVQESLKQYLGSSYNATDLSKETDSASFDFLKESEEAYWRSKSGGKYSSYNEWFKGEMKIGIVPFAPGGLGNGVIQEEIIVLKSGIISPGIVQSRINIAIGQTRFTPIRPSTGNPVSAGWDHVIDGHFGGPLSNSRSVFSTSQSELKEILMSQAVIKSPVTAIEGGQFVRTVNVGEIVGNTALKFGGEETTWIKVFTDKAGNLITTYPVPAP